MNDGFAIVPGIFDSGELDAITRERGGVIVMRPLIVHASSKVTAAASRRVLHFEYAAAVSFEEGVRLRAA